MVFVPVPDTLEVVVRAQWTNLQPIVNVWHLNKSAGTNTQDARDLLNNWQDHIVPNLADNYVLLAADFREIDTAEGETGTILPDPTKPLVGGQIGESVPPQVAVLVHKRTDAPAGHRGGRSYIGPIREADVTEDGGIVAATRDSLQSSFDLFLAGLDTAPHLVVSRRRDNNADLPVGTSAAVVALEVDQLVATQRRRLR